MKTKQLILAAGVLALVAAFWPRQGMQESQLVEQGRAKPRVAWPATPAAMPAAAVAEEPLLPAPALGASEPNQPAAVTTAAPQAIVWAHGSPFVRPGGETMMSTWAARDPEGAGRWLNQNRQHPQFADMVRGYAIQIATIDPAAARQWAAQIPAGQNRFGRGGTLEQHIDAVERMLTGQPGPNGQTMLFEDFRPVLVRQNEGEEPVLEMEPLNPFG